VGNKIDILTRIINSRPGVPDVSIADLGQSKYCCLFDDGITVGFRTAFEIDCNDLADIILESYLVQTSEH
jgi:hypothetical protein